MRKEDFDEFKGQLKQLCVTLGKSYSDPLAQAYWRVLRDVPLEDVQRHVERILLNAGGDTKFPKPAQLRSTPSARPQLCADPAFRTAEQRSIEVLEALRKTDLERWFAIIGERNAAFIVRSHGSTNVFFDPQEMCWRGVPR